MTAPPIQYGGAALDLSPRLFRNATVVASPAASAETIIASLTLNEDVAVMEGAVVWGFAAFTVGTNGVSLNLRIRKTDVAGTVLKATGAVTYTAADLASLSIVGFDTGPTLPNQIYVLTAIVASGSAPSTVSAVELGALVV